jgi:hypothetical protein
MIECIKIATVQDHGITTQVLPSNFHSGARCKIALRNVNHSTELVVNNHHSITKCCKTKSAGYGI